MAKPKEKLDFDLKAERIKRGLSQKDLAKAIGANRSTVSTWERERYAPYSGLRHILLDFLANTPVLRTTSWSVKEICERIEMERIKRNVSKEEIAYQIGVDTKTLRHWIANGVRPRINMYHKLEAFFYPESADNKHEKGDIHGLLLLT